MRDTEDDPRDSALPPWWCGRCDGSKCVDCASARVALERKRRNAPDDADCDEELDGWK